MMNIKHKTLIQLVICGAMLMGATTTHSATYSLDKYLNAKANFLQISGQARLGDAESQFALASSYFLGQGVKKNHSKAFEWMSKAAAQDHVKAITALGYLYQEGAGTPQDLNLAVAWYRKGAALGDDNALQAMQLLNKIQPAANEQDLKNALTCQGWNDTESNSFYNVLAKSYLYSNTDYKETFAEFRFTALSELFLKQFKAEDPDKYYPEYIDADGDVPGVGVYLAKNTNSPILKIETFDRYGYGNLYETIRKDAMSEMKSYLEQRDGIQFYSYTKDQVKNYQTEFNRIYSGTGNTDFKAVKKLNQKYPYLNTVTSMINLEKNKKPTQIYVIQNTNVMTEANGGFARFIYMHDLPEKPNQYTLSCGDTQVFDES